MHHTPVARYLGQVAGLVICCQPINIASLFCFYFRGRTVDSPSSGARSLRQKDRVTDKFPCLDEADCKLFMMLLDDYYCVKTKRCDN